MRNELFRNLLVPLALMMVVPAAGAIGRDALLEAKKRHPAAEQLDRLFPQPPGALPAGFEPTGLTRRDYLGLVAGNVDFWKKHQDAAGAIIDFNEASAKDPRGVEKQYSTPAFALAAATLVKESGRDGLLDPAVRAFDFALTALLNRTTANQHPDFYIPMLVHAHRILKTRAPRQQAEKWEEQFKRIIPEQIYKDRTAGANWNVVNVAGEALRRKDGLVAAEKAKAQEKYLDAMLQKQQRRFTPFGMYEDPHAPLAYDAFPRMWLEDMLADRAYDGREKPALEQFLATGAFSSLLLMSPTGEWASGGRSAHHQWNEAENAVIGEINAARWKAAGRDDIAGAFKRMARMGLKSMLRWQRPGADGGGGEMWIVKNFAEPEARLGFEGYSFHSQYNLLPAAMLCIAHQRADEAIAERPLPAEYGSYLFDVRETFNQVVAASGGYYVQVNSSADRHYNATGLQRVHRRGVALSPLSDSAASHRSYQAAKDDPKAALAPGVQWKAGDRWVGLMDFHRPDPPRPKPGAQPAPQPPQTVVKSAELKAEQGEPRVEFSLDYALGGPDERPVREAFSISLQGVECLQQVTADQRLEGRVVFPVLVHDGARETKVEITGNTLRIRRAGGALAWTITSHPDAKIELAGGRIPTHNGYVRAAVAPIPDLRKAVVWTIELEPGPPLPAAAPAPAPAPAPVPAPVD